MSDYLHIIKLAQMNTQFVIMKYVSYSYNGLVKVYFVR